MNREVQFQKQLESMDLDIAKMLFIVVDLLSRTFENKESPEIEYTKSFFTTYYFIDAETFSKWIKIFCPDLAADYKKKRKFNAQEANYIFQNLGSLPVKFENLVDRKVAMAQIYKNANWKKSRLYAEFSLELKERFPNLNIRLNKLPPKLMFAILKDELEHVDFSSIEERDMEFEQRFTKIYHFFEHYKSVDERQWEVRKRWLRIQFNKPMEDDITINSPSNS